MGAWRNRFETSAPAAEQAPTDAAKPTEQSPGEKVASDNPGARAANGETPIKPSDRTDAAENAPATPSVRQDTADLVATPPGSGLKGGDSPGATSPDNKDAE